MKSISSAIVVFAGVILFNVGVAERMAASLRESQSGEGGFARFLGCAVIAIGIIGWWR